MIEVKDGAATKRVQSRRLEALIRALLADERTEQGLALWRTGRIALWWAGDEAGVEKFEPTDFHKRRSGGEK